MTIRIGTIRLGGLRVGPQGPPGAAASTADAVTYDPTASGLAATDVQAAVDELASAAPAAHAASHASGGSDALTPDAIGAVPTSRQVIAGTGLTGGGALSADRTLAVSYGTTAGTACQGNDSRLSNARTPTAHASSHAPGGSDPLAAATTSVAGFMSAADKTKLDALYGHRHVTSDVTLAATDRVVTVDASGGNRTLTLPSPASIPAGCGIIVKKVSTGTNTISLARSGSEQIEGAAATYALPGSDGATRPAWMVWHDGTNWWIA